MLHPNGCSTRFALIILCKGQFLVLMYIRIGINKGTPASFSPFSVPQMFYILPVSVPISLALWPHFDTSSTVSSFIFFKNGQTIHVCFYLYPFYRCCRREATGLFERQDPWLGGCSAW
ncbi:hypothetical protein BKA57DRAFT_243612 [Linnemannia elongata]|nr:hypothetical protein BKA57DRAFT_230551 [Linnemannia elongata]KAH7055061.1 hypothetical protein BKA57DRAFT_243612 [Linnemannia elongata]